MIEIDGFSHDARLVYHDARLADDASRTEGLERAGYRVIRFTNDDVFERIERALTIIREALVERPTPPRKREGSFVA